MYQIILSGGSPIYQKGLCGLLTEVFPANELTVVNEEDDGHTVNACDLWIVVVQLRPNIQQLERWVRRLGQCHGLLIGGHISLALLKRLRSLGMLGYLLYSATSERLRQAVTKVMAGQTYVDPDLRAALLDHEIDRDHSPYPAALTAREEEVLQLIIQEHTSQEIAGKLFISQCTVETHRAHLLQKLGVRNTAGIVREAIFRELYTV